MKLTQKLTLGPHSYGCAGLSLKLHNHKNRLFSLDFFMKALCKKMKCKQLLF